MTDPVEHITHLAAELSHLGNFWFGVFFILSTGVYYTLGALRESADVIPDRVRRMRVVRVVVRVRYPAEVYVPTDADESN